jgi:hypothetical protein
MDTLGLCQPSSAILLVSVAGVIYHAAVGSYHAMLWWLVVAVLGTGVFQALCFGGLEPLAWVIMMIPLLIVCFFLAVALFASRMRIENIMAVPCGRCQQRHVPWYPCSGNRGGGYPGEGSWCNKTRCNACNGCGCRQCLLGGGQGA